MSCGLYPTGGAHHHVGEALERLQVSLGLQLALSVTGIGVGCVGGAYGGEAFFVAQPPGSQAAHEDKLPGHHVGSDEGLGEILDKPVVDAVEVVGVLALGHPQVVHDVVPLAIFPFVLAQLVGQ